jgi:hypothetical protein
MQRALAALNKHIKEEHDGDIVAGAQVLRDHINLLITNIESRMSPLTIKNHNWVDQLWTMCVLHYSAKSTPVDKVWTPEILNMCGGRRAVACGGRSQ